MSTVAAARRRIMGVRFHPTEAELINFLKRFLKGEPLPSECPNFQLADIYGDQPPWKIFGANSDHPEEKVHYFLTRLKKPKSEHTRVRRTCANGTWKGQTGIDSIKNGKGTVVGFRRSFKFQSSTKEGENNKIWLMKEYFVGDDFFRENNIPKEDIVVCRIKKNTRSEKNHGVNMEEQDVANVIGAMLHGRDKDYCTTVQPITICEAAKHQVMDEAQKMNEHNNSSYTNDCSNYQEEINWADEVLLDIDDFGDIICC
ncbi:NAC domain-containing protein 2-like [Nicotiana tabacum]|uniref:NAC domain-containing protein 2-like n=2 Tax=Nicotiana TaxID=4085 RepID=A0A1S4BMM2_TOBAC|nr:PREDICTED: NAC domain-containing protein 78-like [Nicotiana sylvestris]XP_016490087.1 PREDICTED: NAC domain-containing protein 78-like [Nicotiana tabacum]